MNVVRLDQRLNQAAAASLQWTSRAATATAVAASTVVVGAAFLDYSAMMMLQPMPPEGFAALPVSPQSLWLGVKVAFGSGILALTTFSAAKAVDGH